MHWVRTVPQLDRLNANEDEIPRLLRAVNKHKSIEPYGIHAATPQAIADLLYKHVPEHYGMSFMTGEIPADWKIATVWAVHRAVSMLKVGNYRLVSLTSVLGRCLGKVFRD